MESLIGQCGTSTLAARSLVGQFGARSLWTSWSNLDLFLSFWSLFLFVMALDWAIPIRSHLVLHSAFALFTRRFSLGLRTKNGLCGSRQVTAHFYYARTVRTEASSDMRWGSRLHLQKVIISNFVTLAADTRTKKRAHPTDGWQMWPEYDLQMHVKNGIR